MMWTLCMTMMCLLCSIYDCCSCVWECQDVYNSLTAILVVLYRVCTSDCDVHRRWKTLLNQLDWFCISYTDREPASSTLSPNLLVKSAALSVLFLPTYCVQEHRRFANYSFASSSLIWFVHSFLSTTQTQF